MYELSLKVRSNSESQKKPNEYTKHNGTIEENVFPEYNCILCATFTDLWTSIIYANVKMFFCLIFDGYATALMRIGSHAPEIRNM